MPSDWLSLCDFRHCSGLDGLQAFSKPTEYEGCSQRCLLEVDTLTDFRVQNQSPLLSDTSREWEIEDSGNCLIDLTELQYSTLISSSVGQS